MENFNSPENAFFVLIWTFFSTENRLVTQTFCAFLYRKFEILKKKVQTSEVQLFFLFSDPRWANADWIRSDFPPPSDRRRRGSLLATHYGTTRVVRIFQTLAHPRTTQMGCAQPQTHMQAETSDFHFRYISTFFFLIFWKIIFSFLKFL